MKWVVKDAEKTATNGTIIDSLDSGSTKDAPSINAFNEALKEYELMKLSALFYLSETDGGKYYGNYEEWVTAGKPVAPAN